MAAGFLRALEPRLRVESAGTGPAPAVHPLAIEVMAEVGVDIADARPQHVDRFSIEPFDYVVTVCAEANERCPNFTGRVGRRLHLGFPDPAQAQGDDEAVRRVFREVRDAIKERFTELYRSTLALKLDGTADTNSA